MHHNRVLLLIIGSLLFLAIGVVLFRHDGGGSIHSYLLDEVPNQFEGWEVKDIPIAESEEMKRAVDELLNFEKAIFRIYSKGGRSLQVYAAYWPPRKFHPRLIADHVPDNCWLSNGWRMYNSDYAYIVPTNSAELWHSQYRRFEASNFVLHVVYWHIVNGRLSGYAEGINSRSNNFAKNIFDPIVHGAGEQFFIRISSPQPLSEWRGDALYEKILRAFSPILTKR